MAYNIVLPKAGQKKYPHRHFTISIGSGLTYFSASIKCLSAFVILFIFSSGWRLLNIPPSAIPERYRQCTMTLQLVDTFKIILLDPYLDNIKLSQERHSTKNLLSYRLIGLACFTKK
jgi:hypothetical protein